RRCASRSMAKVVSLAILIDPIGSITTTTSRGIGAGRTRREGRPVMLAHRPRPRPARAAPARAACRRSRRAGDAGAQTHAGLDRFSRYWDIDTQAAVPGMKKRRAQGEPG